ncbi:hypothetical protein [Beggiatoa leptomitoformis]|uniref:Uncharacterized protein n=1 Tax=Beggiatoa leptomitoformis TaxID=288004 RepID=A0A2N9YDE3_9GAMM|nr:hypothetical protein [Beggiatoa leptomitoformis]ALG69081.2 hypothetical protein AL038_17045 [Beggiatoa leptomitoformis]AUI68508.2 hypothetical protein BLE401_07190 [Beggiatoa leptomitoformis]
MMPIFRVALLLVSISWLSACQSEEQTISKPFYPISLAYWANRDVFLVGSYADASINLVKADGTVEGKFQLPYSDGRQHALRLSVDNTRQQLWALDQGMLTIYTLANQQLLHKILLPSHAQCQPPLFALVLDSSGAAYVGGMNCYQIYRVDPIDLQARVWVTLPQPLNALVLNKSAEQLIGIASNGSLWRIALETKQITSVRLSRPLPNLQTTVLDNAWLAWNMVSVQAMSWQTGSVLYLLHGTSPALVKIELTTDERYAEVRDLPHTGFDTLMAGVYQNGFAYTPETTTHIAWYSSNQPLSPLWVRKIARN